MNDEKRDALYREYQNRLRNIEEEKEEYQRNKRKLEEEKEEFTQIYAEGQEDLRIYTADWGECKSLGRLRQMFGDFFDEYKKNLVRKEEDLESKYRTLRLKEQDIEEDYTKAIKEEDE